MPFPEPAVFPPITLPGGSVLDYSRSPLVMAVVNCNGDSFYPASRGASAEKALALALRAAGDGADIIDLGGESTRPGAAYVDADEEIRRVAPVVRAFRRQSALPLSIDTRKAAVAKAALDEGADIINDIAALEDDPLLGETAARYGAAVVLMHKQGVPADMQINPRYGDFAAELAAYLKAAAARALTAGIAREKIILDPGIGFGKTLRDNLEILRRLEEICGRDYPLLIGLSRKTFIGEITGRPAEERLAGTLAANAAACFAGAHIIRVHDVKEHADMAKIFRALRGE